ncbi:MAG TPA: MEKHLA domain-containing protein [Planctomycetaceae bacterium]|nr:MEKHLA domain-containing protein [Planctomycetaceae bacterium]
MPSALPFESSDWIARTQILLDSYRRLLGTELLPREGTAAEQSAALFRAPFVVVAHGTEADPILNYANQAALDLWETDLETFLAMPSRKTAEPVHRDERARLMQRVTDEGFIDDYSGIRISATGKRFLIRRAVVWNLADADESYVGQAATFSEWEFLG